MPLEPTKPATSTILYAAQGAILLIVILLLLHAGSRDFSVPLRFTNDSLQYQMIAKTTVETGWYWFNPRQSAPFRLTLLHYPINSNIDQSLVWLVSQFSRSPAFCLAIAWCVMVALAGMIASFCMRRLGLSMVSALVCGSLYAFLPYSLYRDIDFFHIVTYLLPLPCTLALMLAGGSAPATRRDKLIFLGVASVLIGLNYTYNAFFACFFILAGAMLGYFTYRKPGIVRAGVAAIGLLCVFTAVDLAPSLYVWHREGKPHMIYNKVPAEAEMYALKIRHLISPVIESSFPPFRKFNQLAAGAQFPLENENMTARLGTAASLGFLLLLAVAFLPQAGAWTNRGGLLVAAAQLSLAGVLLGTIGGFGSIFSMLVAPDIRAYNRVTPFIGFFSLVAIAVVLDRIWPWLVRKAGGRPWIAAAAGLLLCGLGVSEQGVAVTKLNVTYPAIAGEYHALKALVSQVESVLPAGSMVYQMPFRIYLGDTGDGRLGMYDSAKPYLVSETLRWSYPDLSNASLYWHEQLSHYPVDQLLPAARTAGFAAILLDRYGYPDDGVAAVRGIEAVLGQGRTIAQDSRYIVFDLRPLGDPKMLARTVKLPRTESALVTAGLPVCGSGLGFIDQIGPHPLPPGVTPAVGSAGDLVVLGWAAWKETKTTAAAVEIVIDGHLYPAFYGLDRTDVRDNLNVPGYRDSGFRASIPARNFAKGAHILSVRVVSPDQKCYQTLSEATFVVE